MEDGRIKKMLTNLAIEEEFKIVVPDIMKINKTKAEIKELMKELRINDYIDRNLL